MQALNVVGFKNSGKTQLILQLADALEAHGFRVALVKHSHNPLDKAGTDTDRMLHGASTDHGRMVLALAKGESALFWNKEQSLAHMLSLLDADMVLVEGGKYIDFMPRILCLREAQEAEALHKGLAIASVGAYCEELAHDVQFAQNLASMVDLVELVAQRAFVLPRLNCGGCACENCFGFARAVVAGERQAHECVAMQASLEVTCEGKTVALNPFMARLYTELLRTMMGELKGVHGGRVTISFDV